MSKYVLGALGALLAAVFGPPFAELFGLLLALMALDLVAALLVNQQTDTLNVTTGINGWRRKAMTLIVVLAVPIVKYSAQQAGLAGLESVPAGAVIAGGFCVMELLSILAHAEKLGVKIPIKINMPLTIRAKPDSNAVTCQVSAILTVPPSEPSPVATSKQD